MKQSYRYIVFDMDGTLCDSQIGIYKGISHSLNQMGIPTEPNATFPHFIGRALQDSFHDYHFQDMDKSWKAVHLFREYYGTKGLFEGTVYPGIIELLANLHAQGKRLFVATAKPMEYARRITQYHQMEQYFTDVLGCYMDGSRADKKEMLQAISKSLGDPDPKEFVMIGDRKYDLLAATQLNMDSIGVTYGYGSQEEIIKAAPTHYVPDVTGLANILL